MHDAFNLQRFIDAQEPVYDGALRELANGHKRTHWMWFIFPQHVALGRSGTAKHFGIHSLDEAKAYAHHDLLGPRLVRCCETLMQVQGRSVHDIFSSPDDMKLKSCLTLFEAAAPGEAVFAKCIDRYFAGERDARTIELLRA